MPQILNFAVENFEIIDERENSQFATAKIEAFSSGLSRNQTTTSVDVLKKTAPSIYLKPVIYYYDKVFNDFGTHDPDKTVPAGFVVPGSADFIERGNRVTLSVRAMIWKRYSGRFLEIFQNDKTDHKKVSVELEIFESEEDEEGNLDLLDYSYNAVCMLGDFVVEGSPGANMTMLSFAEEKKEYEDAFRLEFGKYDELDFQIPAKVKENAKQGLELHKKHGRGGSSVSLALARHLANSDVSNHEKIRNLAKLSTRYAKKDLADREGNDYIAYLSLGGDEGYQWAIDLAKKVDDIDNRQLAHFEAVSKELPKDENPVKKEEMSVEEEEKKEEEFEKKEEEETPEEEKKETPEEEKKEEEEGKEEKKDEKFSLDANLDTVALLKMLENETDKYQEIAAQFEKAEPERDYAMLVHAMYQKMCKMESDCRQMMAEKEEMCGKYAQSEEMCKQMAAENEELKAYKAQIEKQQFQFAVEAKLKEVAEVMPKDEVEKLREESVKYDLATFSQWDNLAGATAFQFAKGKKSKEEFTRMAIPDLGGNGNKKSGSVWDRIN